MRRAYLYLGVVAALAAIAPWLPTYYVGLLTEAAIVALFAMSLDLLVGFLALESLGHAAYFGMGAYIAGLLALAGFTNVWLILIAAALGAGALAAVFGVVALRASGPYFLIITMALSNLAWGLAIRWRALTGGDDGLAGVPRPDLMIPVSLNDTHNFFYFTLLICVLAAVALHIIGQSAFGQSLRGIKDSASRMEALGYNVWLHKYLAFVTAGLFAGVAGFLYAYYNSFVSPQELSVYRSAEALVAVILGGAGTLIGPAIGAILILFVRFTISIFTDKWALVLGTIYILVVLFAPRGILGMFRRTGARRKAAETPR
ncbi:MAG: branched-chain amino acid ABC transporter permease [Pseudorhodoplanes sp.]